jgi:hypothetical protein
VQRQEPALLELRLSDDEPIRGHVVHLQCQCFSDPHAGYGEQAEERCVHCRSDRACRLECRCGAKQSCNLVRTIDVRRAPLGDGVAERIRCRNLMAPVLGVHRQREPSHGEQSIAALLRRWRTCGPCKDTSTLDVPVTVLLGEGDVAPQQDVLDTELES